jgi:hypothetical protein
MGMQAMTLEEYRIHIIGRLKAFRDPAEVRELLAQVDLGLKGTGVSVSGQSAFWEALTQDLNGVAHDAPLLVGVQDAELLVRVVSAAQSGIEWYQGWLGSAEDKSYR